MAQELHFLKGELDRKMKEVDMRLKQKGGGGPLTEGSDLYRKLLKMINEKASIDDVG